ncbi:hypothetical protein [Terasakiella pusilla]|uniref:hypothetical protein n=1 Tax=Terasakiella pusilla TaxID=64973 RepID=UPI003AA7D5C4
MLDLTVQDFNGEPRMRDVDIAEALGFERPRVIRELISRCAESLAAFGDIARRTARRANKFNPYTQEYWLNEHQAFYLCTQSKAKRAIKVTQQIINVFVAWRHDRLGGHAKPLTTGAFEVTPDTPAQLALVREARLLHGRVAGQKMWRSVGFPELPIETTEKQRASSTASEAQGGEVMSFLHEHFVFTGENSDFIRSKAVYEVYSAFYDGEPPLGPRALATRLHALARVYRCPASGGRFWPARSNHTGYRGLRLIS